MLAAQRRQLTAAPHSNRRPMLQQRPHLAAVAASRVAEEQTEKVAAGKAHRRQPPQPPPKLRRTNEISNFSTVHTVYGICCFYVTLSMQLWYYFAVLLSFLHSLPTLLGIVVCVKQLSLLLSIFIFINFLRLATSVLFSSSSFQPHFKDSVSVGVYYLSAAATTDVLFRSFSSLFFNDNCNSKLSYIHIYILWITFY